MTRSNLDRWLLGAAGLVGLLLLAILLTFQNTSQLNEDARRVGHTHEVIAALKELAGRLREAESNQRSFIIVGGPRIPPDFDSSTARAREVLASLQTLTRDNPEQQARLPEVDKQVEDLVKFWRNTMTVRQQQGLEAAQKIVAAGQSRKLMAALQDRLAQLEETERGLLVQRRSQREQTYRAALATGLLTGVAALAGVVAFTMLMRRHLAARDAAAQVIAEQGERLRTTLASIGDGVIATDSAGRITNLNAVAEELTGWKLDEALGRPLGDVFRIVNEDTRRPVDNPATRALTEGVIVGLANHTVLIAKDGTERPIDDSAAPIRCKAGQIVGCVLVFRDVAQRRRLEKDNAGRLQAARHLSSIVQSSDDAIISKSLQGVVLTWNAAAERIFGYAPAEAIGQHISFLIPPERLEEEDRIIASLKAGQRVEHFETVRRRKDGRLIMVALTISPIKDETGQVVGASKIVRDITERQRAEAERQRLVTVVESSTDFIGMCDLQGVPFFINGAGLRLVGLDSIEQARRTPVRDFFFPEDQAMIMDEFFPSVLVNGHGAVDVRFRNFKTGAARWMAYKVLTLKDADGQPVGLATVSQDVSERRQLEDSLRQLAADLSEADRRKDEFLATLAHELRNPLAPIRNALKILHLSADPQAKEQARALMERQLEQLVRLVDDLLDVSRVSQGKLELRRDIVELTTIVNNAVETSRPMIDQQRHQLCVTLPSQPILLHADLTRLAQVLSNLLNNSAKYMDEGGRIWLTAQQEGSDAVISVKDTGIGIAADQLRRIFEMFSQVDRSLERSHGGLGIGLTLVKRLVEMHGGRVEARSDGLGKGSEFIIRLPVAVEATRPAPANGAEQLLPPPRSSLRILIVDDNQDSADSLSMLLGIMGNETRTAYDGQEGVEVAEEFRPGVIVLDIGLPRLNGYEACRHLRQQPWAKDVVLIAVTGWGQDDDRRLSQEAGFDHHLVKPVNPQELLKLLAGLEPVKT